MKIRLVMCFVALFALVAASCGSDDSIVEAVEEAVADTPAADEPADETMDDEDAMEDDEAMADEDHSDDEAMADEDAMEDDAAMADDAMADGPQRIVSLSPTGTEMLFAIGAGDQVIAVDSFSYFPEEAPVTDLSAFEPNIEAIAGFEPDLIVVSNPIEGLDAIGVDVFVAPAATDLDDIYTQIEQLGAATGNVGGAAELVLQMQTDIDAVLADIPNRDVALTYYHELDNTLYSVTSGTFIGYVYSLFGLENVADTADGAEFGYPQLNEEYVITADPDIIFLADTLCCEQTAETIATRPGWDQLSAVTSGNVVELNDDVVSRWGPRIVDFIAAVGAAVNDIEVAPAS